MKLKKAIEILEQHNKWRRFNGEIDDSPEMPDVTELGIAIDTVVNYYKTNDKCN